MPNGQYQTCIEACMQCAVACERCCDAPRPGPGVSDPSECMRLDCAQVCRVAATLMSRGSSFVREVCRVCATICQACADEYAQHDHESCQHCAEACRRCAEECSRTAAVIAHPEGRRRED